MRKTKFMEEMIKMLTFKRMKFQPKTKVLGKNIKIKIKNQHPGCIWALSW